MAPTRPRIPPARDKPTQVRSCRQALPHSDRHILDDTARAELDPDSLAAIKNVSGAGFPGQVLLLEPWRHPLVLRTAPRWRPQTASQFSLEETRLP